MILPFSREAFLKDLEVSSSVGDAELEVRVHNVLSLYYRNCWWYRHLLLGWITLSLTYLM